MKAEVESAAGGWGQYRGSYRMVVVECPELADDSQRGFFWDAVKHALQRGFDVTIPPLRRAFRRW